MVSIKGLRKGQVLAALYNHSRPLGMGFLNAIHGDMTENQANKELDDRTVMFGSHNPNGLYFDYLHGRVMKVDISGDEFDESLYDRDLGPGRAQKAIDSIK